MREHAGEPVGTLAEEAARLMEAAQQWAGGATAGVPLATESAECQVCPVCQLVRAARGVRPETVEHLVTAVASLASALRSVVDGAGPSHDHDPGAGGTPRSPVQRIDIG